MLSDGSFDTRLTLRPGMDSASSLKSPAKGRRSVTSAPAENPPKSSGTAGTGKPERRRLAGRQPTSGSSTCREEVVAEETVAEEAVAEEAVGEEAVGCLPVRWSVVLRHRGTSLATPIVSRRRRRHSALKMRPVQDNPVWGWPVARQPASGCPKCRERSAVHRPVFRSVAARRQCESEGKPTPVA